MTIRKVSAGRERVALASRLLQRARLADATAGVWEAADIQWWSRSPRLSDDLTLPFWLDEDGPVGAVLLTDWTVTWGVDVLRVPNGGVPMDEIWEEARGVMAAAGRDTYESLVRDDDEELVSRLLAAGFTPESRAWEAWMDAAERPRVTAPPESYRLVDRTQTRGRPHPMAGRSGQDTEARLGGCSLYDPALDLAIEAPDGSFAGYALFWADPVTHVGLLEPMRVEEEHARRGLARSLLSEGLDRLARRGMARMKVGFESDAARGLYVGAGFHPQSALSNFVMRRT